MTKSKLQSIPTNIVTGFLGAGKTSAILNLLKQKPANERWAILVNEFGEIGVDGSLFEGHKTDDKNIFIQEVSGGCMCCSSEITMQVALNKLLKDANPHRLIIEPTGLGHPIEVIEVLSNKYYKDVLSLEKIITLVDARNLQDTRYTEHKIFNQQLFIADIIAASKTDLYGANDKETLIDYVAEQPINPEQMVFISHAELPLELLAGKTLYVKEEKSHHHLHHKPLTLKGDEVIPESGFIKAVNKGEGFESVGWRFSSLKTFNREKLYTFISSLNVTRLKAVFLTSEGIYSYNIANDSIIENKLNTCDESRIEIICDQVDSGWEPELLSCLIS